MILRLMLHGLKRGKARFLCAVLGIAAAVGAVVFTFSLTATNAAQAPALAKRAAAPWAAWQFDGGPGRSGESAASPRRAPQTAVQNRPRRPHEKADLTLSVVGMTIDYRPGGRVLQGPPMMAVIAAAPSETRTAARNSLKDAGRTRRLPSAKSPARRTRCAVSDAASRRRSARN